MGTDWSQPRPTPLENSDSEEPLENSDSPLRPRPTPDSEKTFPLIRRDSQESFPSDSEKTFPLIRRDSELESSDSETVPPMVTDWWQPRPTPLKNSDSEEIISDYKLDVWITSRRKMLATVSDDRVKASSISTVSDQLKKFGAEAYYVPKVVSIGPLHRGRRRELLYMEDVKWRCMLSLFHRTEDPADSHEKCSRCIFEFDALVRASYEDDIKFDAYDLASIMLLDGCFLLELLISNNPELDQKYKKLEEPEKKSPGAAIGKMPLVLSDLKLLENQVPILILIVLFQWLFAAEETFEDVRKIVNDSALILLRCNSNSIPAKNPPAHFLELLHWNMTGEEDAIDQGNNGYHSITVERPKLQHCATKLEAAGVKIEFIAAQSMSMKFVVGEKKKKIGCDIKSKGTLQIMPLRETKEVQWRNLIAWEHNRIIHEKFLKKENRTRCIFSQYALLFNDLVCCEHDIQLLKDRGVLRSVVEGGDKVTWQPNSEQYIQQSKGQVELSAGYNRDSWSNEDLMNLFRNVAKEFRIDAGGDVRFAQQIDELNAFGKLIDQLHKHSGVTARGYCRIFWHLCRCIVTNIRYKCRNLYAILKRDHIPTPWKKIGLFAAIVLLLLTIAQTIFGAIQL